MLHELLQMPVMQRILSVVAGLAVAFALHRLRRRPRPGTEPEAPLPAVVTIEIVSDTLADAGIMARWASLPRITKIGIVLSVVDAVAIFSALLAGVSAGALGVLVGLLTLIVSMTVVPLVLQVHVRGRGKC